MMRRSDREITDKEELIKIIDRYKVIRIAMQSDRGLYIIPLNYGYAFQDRRLVFYFHSARSGRKIDIMKENGEICFEIDGSHALIADVVPCKYSSTYESIIGYGHVEFLDNLSEKAYALNILMKHQAGKEFQYPESALESTMVGRINVSSFTGKRHMPAAFAAEHMLKPENLH